MYCIQCRCSLNGHISAERITLGRQHRYYIAIKCSISCDCH